VIEKGMQLFRDMRSSAFRSWSIRKLLYMFVSSHFRDATPVPVRWKML